MNNPTVEVLRKNIETVIFWIDLKKKFNNFNIYLKKIEKFKGALLEKIQKLGIAQKMIEEKTKLLEYNINESSLKLVW